MNVALLSLPTLLLVLGALLSTVWRLPTRIAVDLVTSRVTFDVRDRNVTLITGAPAFSRLVVERCGSASFEAAIFLGVESTKQRRSSPYVGPVRLKCVDPDSKLTLEGPVGSFAGLGTFDRLELDTGTTVALEVAGTTAPVITIDLSTPKSFDLPISGEFQLTAEHVVVEPLLDSQNPPSVFQARLSDANRWFHLQSGERRTTLIVTPSADSVRSFFNERVRIPVANPQFLEETSAGLVPAFLSNGKLTYPDHPDVRAVDVKGEDYIVLRQTTGMEISHLGLWQQRPALTLTVEGRVANAAIGQPDAGAATEERTGQWLDPRLTVYEIVRHGPLWSLIAAVATWGVATTWAWYEGWKKLSG